MGGSAPASRLSIDATVITELESIPPESAVPTGTSDRNLKRTASTKSSRVLSATEAFARGAG